MERSRACVRAAVRVALVVAAGASSVSVGFAQNTPFDRLPPALLDVTPPSVRASGAPGRMAIRRTSCGDLPMEEVRRRIVDIAVQEWGFFGFTVVDQTNIDAGRAGGAAYSTSLAAESCGICPGRQFGRRLLGRDARRAVGSSTRRTPFGTDRAASRSDGGIRGRRPSCPGSCAKPVSATPADSSARWRTTPTSTKPSGRLLPTRRPPVFPRTTSARRRLHPATCYAARGDQPIGRLPNGAARWEPVARTHCDIVVKLDAVHDRILAIGGNVRGTVALETLAGGARARQGPASRQRSASLLRPPEAARRADRGGCVQAHADDAGLGLRRMDCGRGPGSPPRTCYPMAPRPPGVNGAHHRHAAAPPRSWWSCPAGSAPGPRRCSPTGAGRCPGRRR